MMLLNRPIAALGMLVLFLLVQTPLFTLVIFDCDESAEPGGSIGVIAVSDSEITSLNVRIETEEGKKIAEFRGFRYQTGTISSPGNISSQATSGSSEGKKMPECFVALVPVSSSAPKGSYHLKAFVTGDEDSYAGFRYTVTEREFRSDIIHLDGEMTELRKDESERRRKETEELVSIYDTFNQESLYFDGLPLKPLSIDAVRSSYFGDRRKFIYESGDRAYSVHNGIDYAVPEGTAVASSARGKVVFAGERIITGKSIVIEHLPGIYSVYYHLEKIAVKTDDIVSEGETIGNTGCTGLSTGPHLHWEIRNQLCPVDPDIFMSAPVIDKERIMGIINDNFSDLARGR